MHKLRYIIFMCMVGCVSKEIQSPIEPLSPDEVEQSIAKLASQSFEFTIKFNKPGVSGSFWGITTNEKTKVEGVWEFDGDKERFVGIGLGEKEYKLENGEWKSGQRTQYTDPISTLKLVCSTGGYKFKGVEGESFLYEFTPNLLFMEPKLFGDSTYGVLWINAKMGLPEKVVAEAENIKWEFEVKSIIREEYHILNPLAKTQAIEVKVEVTTPQELQGVARILKERFELYGFDEVKHKLLVPNPTSNSREYCIVFEFLSESVSSSLMQSLVQPGKVELYRAAYPRGSEYELKGAHFIKGDPTLPVFLSESIECKVVDVSFESGVSEEYIKLIFDKDLPEDEHIAVVIDGEVIGFVPKVWGKSLKIEADKLTWIKIKLPLPELGLRIKD